MFFEFLRNRIRLALGPVVALALLVLALSAAPPLQAQTTPAPQSEPASQTASTATTAPAPIDYEAWEQAANAAENLISGGLASTTFFEARRADLAAWRTRFLTAQSANAERIATIQAQIDALGPAPAEGVSEAEAIATRRAELTDRLAQAQAPQLRANEALNRANGLISEIDAILADRQTQELLELEATPLNPVNWATALGNLASLLGALQADFALRVAAPDARQAMLDNAPALLGLVLLGLAMILRGRRVVHRLGERFFEHSQRRGRIALTFTLSLGQILVPILGFVLLESAFEISGLLSDDAQALLSAALALIIALFAGLWIGGRLFPDHEDRPAAFEAGLSLRAPGRRILFLIGLLTGLANLAEVVAGLDSVSPAARGVLVVPLHLGLALSYWRLASLLARLRADRGDQDASVFSNALLAVAINALRLIAVVGASLGLVGYINAGEALMIPTALSLFVLGLLVALQPVIRDLHTVFFRTDYAAAGEALLPILVNFALVLMAMPVLAVVWGLRPERLSEIYVRVLEGFSLGDTQITPGIILAVILVFAGGMLVTRLLQGALRTTVLPRTRMDLGARNAVISGVGYVGIALAALIAVTSAGIDLTALGFVVGALSVGIGFGLQNVVSNFVSGIILLIERPISEGDWIEVNGNMGIVRDISVRSTTIETFDKTDVIVPNADFISGTVTNWTRGNTVGRAIITVGVAYGTDTRRVSAILREIADNHPDVSSFPEPGVDFLGFGADSLDFRMRCILRDINKLVAVKTEIHHQIAERFTEEGIEIPFAQRDIWLRNPEALAAQARPDPAADADPQEDPETDLDTAAAQASETSSEGGATT